MERVVHHLHNLVYIHESNKIAVFSDILAKQISRSFAANAFNVVLETLYQHEIIRLCSIWDRESVDRESIPSVLALVDNSEVRRMIAEETYAHHANRSGRVLLTDDKPDFREIAEQMAHNYAEKRGRDQARKTISGLCRAIRNARALLNSDEMQRTRLHRDNHMAHALNPKAVDVELMKGARYGDERALFEKTIPIVDELYLWIDGSSYGWEDARENAQICAAELWKNCKFSIPRQ